MKKMNVFAFLLLAGAMILSGCGASNTVKGTGIGKRVGVGAVVGAGVGALLGGGKGAAIGASMGATIGAKTGGAAAVIGHKMEKQKVELEKIQNVQVESINDGQAIKITFESGILFSTGKSDLSVSSKTALSQFAASLQANPDTDIQIYGHTDSRGGDKVNVPLSRQRAQSVADYLSSQGVSAERMTTQGMGSSQPVANEDVKGVQAQNRRVEVYILPNAKMIKEAEADTLK